MPVTSYLIIGYKRYESLKNIVEKLFVLDITKIYICLDGPKNDEDILVQERIKKYLDTRKHDLDIKTLFSNENLGCRKNVSRAIDWFFTFEKMGVILEDDLKFDTQAIVFLEKALKHFQTIENVGVVTAYSALDKEVFKVPNQELIVSFPSSWAWGTWKDRWEKYRDVEKRMNKLTFSLMFFKYGGIAGFRRWNSIRKKILKDELDSWAYIWLFTNLKHHFLTVIPTSNLVENIGFDEHATHTKHGKSNSIKVNKKEIDIETFERKFERNKLLNKWYLKNVYGIYNYKERIKNKLIK